MSCGEDSMLWFHDGAFMMASGGCSGMFDWESLLF